MKKLISKIILIMALIVIAMPLISKAGFQADKGGTSYTVTESIYANVLFDGIRKMETAGGTLGLTADLEPKTYLDNTKNGLDCHMAKSTEWGTAAMLAASVYGKAPSGKSSTATTTGNESGICQMANGNGQGGSSGRGQELVAGIYNSSDTHISAIKNADSRYYNLYGSNIIGDGLSETVRWKGASSATGVSGSYPILQRDFDGLFGFYDHYGCYDYYSSSSNGTRASARAVVVSGEGL